MPPRPRRRSKLISKSPQVFTAISCSRSAPPPVRSRGNCGNYTGAWKKGTQNLRLPSRAGRFPAPRRSQSEEEPPRDGHEDEGQLVQDRYGDGVVGIHASEVAEQALID